MDEPQKTDEELAPAPPADEPEQDELAKTDEELAAAAEAIADNAIAIDAALQVPVAAHGTPGPAAVGAIMGVFTPRPLLDPEELVGRPVAGQPSTIHLEDAIQHWQLEPEDVLSWREVPEVELVLVTAGGKKLRWPDDMDVRLTDGARGRSVPPANRVFPDGYLHRDASKDPTD